MSFKPTVPKVGVATQKGGREKILGGSQIVHEKKIYYKMKYIGAPAPSRWLSRISGHATSAVESVDY